MPSHQELTQAIAILEQLNPTLDDATIATLLTTLRQQVAHLEQPKVNLAGERRQVTVMFADISGFTAMSEKLDPEEVRNTINGCFELLGAAITRYGGYIDKFIGDEIMALFGAPVTHENDPERALRAALEMMGALTEFNTAQADRLPKPLALHFGINTGLAIAGGIGTTERQDYSVMGDTVNLAARLEDLSETGEILVGATTYRLTAPLFEFETLRPVRLKGKAQPVQVYRLLRAKAIIGGQIRGIEGLSSPLVGRQPEFEQLKKLLNQLKHGQGYTVSVTGDAGLGKSRLVAELRNLTTQEISNVRWAKGHALSYGENASYLMGRDMLRNFLNLPLTASPLEVAVCLQNELNDLLPNQAPSLYPYLAYLLEIPLDSEMSHQLKYLDGLVLQQRILQAMQSYLAAAAKQMPLMLVWDDLHWIDPSSLELLRALLPLVKQYALCHVLIYRPLPQNRLGPLRSQIAQVVEQVEVKLTLEPINLAESQQLVDNLLGAGCLPAATCQLITQKAEGNPFFIEEVIRSLIDQGRVIPKANGQGWEVAGQVEEITIPDTLQGVIMARIDSLDAESKRILQIASVLGRNFSYQVLAQIIAKKI